MQILIKAAFGLSAIAISSCSTLSERGAYINEAGQTCRPKFRQIYQPPITLGGSGRVIMVPNGETCRDVPPDNINSSRPVGEKAMAIEGGMEDSPFTRYGLIQGELAMISADAIVDERMGPVFPAEVRLSAPYVGEGHLRRDVQSGMNATAEVKTGDRRIIDFVLSPIAKAGRGR